ncbi:MAG: tyrosine-type recombinase/integrase [Archaeoglobaceae archaeon]|nr:tyrosine-type recombinase/integrase [Archaeoglobaceae archaeon]
MGKKELVDWFTIGEIKTRKFPDELLTEDDIKKMIGACKNPRDRALIAVLWESGFRVGELGNMRVRDVELTDEGTWIKLFGKTVKDLCCYHSQQHTFQIGSDHILIQTLMNH